MTELLVRPSAAREAFEAKGVVQVRGVLGADEVAHIRDVFTRHVEAGASTMAWDDGIAPGDILSRYPRYVHPHRQPETAPGRIAADLMFDPRIFDIVEDLIGPAYGAQSMFYFKPPSARGQALHQDNASLQAHPETCLAAWIATDDCDGANGSLMVVPGSHRERMLCLDDVDVSDYFNSKGILLPDGVELVQTEMKAGDVLFFNGSIVHGSHANTSADRFRRALIFHYIPRSSVEVAKFYDPLLTPDGAEHHIADAQAGGPCGVDWVGGAD